MENKSIVINAMEPSLVKAAVEAVQARYPVNDPNHQGHRTRPGLSPQHAAQDLIGRTATANRACVIYDSHGAILAIRYRPDAGCKEAWEGVAIAGHPADECYRQAYDKLFDHNERPAPAGSTSLSLDFVHLRGVGEDVGELSVNCGWGFSAVGFQPR